MANRVIQVAKIPQPKAQPLRTLAQFCFYFPRYSLAEARKLPFKHVQLMLREAQRIEAVRYYNLTQIAAAPNSEKGKAVKDLLNHFRGQING